MTKRVVPVTDARGYFDAATTAALLDGPLKRLRKPGQEVSLDKPFTLVAMSPGGDVMQIFDEFCEGSVVARVQVEKKHAFSTYYIRTKDGQLVVIFKQPDDNPGVLLYIYHRDGEGQIVYPRPSIATSLLVQTDATPTQWSWNASA